LSFDGKLAVAQIRHVQDGNKWSGSGQRAGSLGGAAVEDAPSPQTR
jgi:hypothetical protein